MLRGLYETNDKFCLVKHVRKVTSRDLVSQYQVGMEQLVYQVWERTTKRHTRQQRRHRGKNKLLTHTAPLKTCEECRPTGNIHMRRPTALTRHDFHDRTNPSNTRIPTAGVTGSQKQSSVTHNKQTREVSPGCVISLLVLTAIVHSWVILACVSIGQFSSPHL